MTGNIQIPRDWSDAPDPNDKDPSAVLKARLVPEKHAPTQIILEGRCPRCDHPTASAHSVDGALDQDESCRRYPRTDDDVATTKTHQYRLIAGRCQCGHQHPGHPEGERGCGASIGIGVRWQENEPRTTIKWARVETTPFEHRDERDLEKALTTQLADARKAAESWRTGLGAFLAVLAAVFFIKGATSFDDLARAWQWILAGLLLVSGAAALYGAYRAIRAAFGTPANEYAVGEGWFWPRIRERLPASTPRRIEEYGTVGAWRDALTGQSVKDLRHAKLGTLIAAIFFALAAAVTWLAPGPSDSERVVLQGRTGSVCGKTVSLRDDVFVVDETQEIPTRDVVAVKATSACPSG